MKIEPGTLYVVATPIGNLEDMTFRAVSVLQQVEAIAVEDTRHTSKLLRHFDISKPLISYHDHNRKSRQPEILARLQQGEALALVSDAGMPGISDPGYELIYGCVQAGVPVVPIPGASAVITALSAAGLPTDRFAFEGFLPTKDKERRDRLTSLQRETRTLVLYEAPHRLRQTLQDLANIFGDDRAVVLARELTKLHEEFWRGTLAEAQRHYGDREPQGEYTVLIAGAMQQVPTLSDELLRAEVQRLLGEGLSRSEASRQLAQQTTVPRRHIYQLALAIPDVAVSDNSPDPDAERD